MPPDPPDPNADDDAEKRLDLPPSLVPRWLALLVLLALLSAAGFSVYSLLAADPPRAERAPDTSDR